MQLSVASSGCLRAADSTRMLTLRCIKGKGLAWGCRAAATKKLQHIFPFNLTPAQSAGARAAPASHRKGCALAGLLILLNCNEGCSLPGKTDKTISLLACLSRLLYNWLSYCSLSPFLQALLRFICEAAQVAGQPQTLSQTWMSFYGTTLCEVLAGCKQVGALQSPCAAKLLLVPSASLAAGSACRSVMGPLR